jgi:hypothetical protein
LDFLKRAESLAAIAMCNKNWRLGSGASETGDCGVIVAEMVREEHQSQHGKVGCLDYCSIKSWGCFLGKGGDIMRRRVLVLGRIAGCLFEHLSQMCSVDELTITTKIPSISPGTGYFGKRRQFCILDVTMPGFPRVPSRIGDNPLGCRVINNDIERS